jgi:AraC-like DNA-binding protein
VEDLARQALMHSRPLGRHFRAATGTTPLPWLPTQRSATPRKLLEKTDDSLDTIAAATGMGTATTLRRRFNRTVGVRRTPTAAPSAHGPLIPAAGDRSSSVRPCAGDFGHRSDGLAGDRQGRSLRLGLPYASRPMRTSTAGPRGSRTSSARGETATSYTTSKWTYLR